MGLPPKYFYESRKLLRGCHRLYGQDHSRGRGLTTTGQPTVSLLPLKAQLAHSTDNLAKTNDSLSVFAAQYNE
jgi:hypothetical protein